MAYIPEHPNIYQGNQVIINSDRLVFNAKDDSILLYSDKAIGFSTNGSFHFDTSNDNSNKFIVNSPNIYLGLRNTALPTEPAVLGHQLEEVLIELIDFLIGMSLDMCFMVSHKSTWPGQSTGMDSANFKILSNHTNQLMAIQGSIKSIMSSTTKLT
jgi:hypothetical protein